MMRKAIDAAIEVPIVPSFTKIGYGIRSRLFDWTPLDSYDLTGQTVVITGGTSGLGRSAADQFAALGASLVLVAVIRRRRSGRPERSQQSTTPNRSRR